jgi:TusA-related sulfurtransferase
LIVWSQGIAPETAPASAPAATNASAGSAGMTGPTGIGGPNEERQPPALAFGADRFYNAGDKGCAFGPMDDIAALMRKMAAGETLEIHATDPSVGSDLTAWCRMTGNTLLDQNAGRYLVRKG